MLWYHRSGGVILNILMEDVCLFCRMSSCIGRRQRTVYYRQDIGRGMFIVTKNIVREDGYSFLQVKTV